MVLTILIAALAVATFISFWNKLRDWLNTRFRPWLAEKFSEAAADRFADFLAWLDDRVVLTRNAFRGTWRFLRERVLHLKREFTVEAGGDVRSVRTAIIKDDQGRFIRKTEETVLPWEDLSGEIRREMIRQEKNTAALDERAVLEKKIRERAETAGFADEMEMMN
jgi:hypothetical protein